MIFWGIILQIAGLIGAIVSFFGGLKKDKISAIGGFMSAAVAFLVSFTMIQIPEPEISRTNDYSAIVLDAEKPLSIKYKVRIDGVEEWKKYDKPITLNKSAVVYAQSKLLFLSSKRVDRQVFVEENGLISFGGADSPRETLKSITAEYVYRDPQNEKSGNHYVGCEISKNDIQVTGVNLKGESCEVNDFTYSPQVLEAGKNDIQISYDLPNGKSITTHLYINATKPQMLKMTAQYQGGMMFAGSELSNDSFVVKGKYEDGTEQELSGYSISDTSVKLGKNTVVITKDGQSVTLELNAVERDSITENEKEPNDDISSANDIEPNVKYTGNLKDEDDVDYYKIQIEKKGKIVLNFKHPKIDNEYSIWNVCLQGTDESEKINMNVTGEAANVDSNTIRVAPGIYYIKVSRYNSEYSSAKYTFVVNFEEEGEYYEAEPNDDLATQAMKIKTNKTYVGNISDYDDVDCYKFTLKEKRKVCLKFTHAKLSEDYTLWQVDLLGDEEGGLTNIYSTGQTAKLYSDNVRLPAGTYYVRIAHYNSLSSDIDYEICVITEKEKGKTENEENDDYSTATKISLGTSIKGNIQSENDIDFYKFVLKKTTNVKITFTHDPVDSDYNLWSVKLYSEESGDGLPNNDGDTYLSVAGNSSKNLSGNWRSLPAGTYYVKIERYNSDYCNNDYKLKVASY